MTGKQLYDQYKANMSVYGKRVVNIWSDLQPEVQVVWNKLAESISTMPPTGGELPHSRLDDAISVILTEWGKAQQQRLYEMLYNIGCRIR